MSLRHYIFFGSWTKRRPRKSGFLSCLCLTWEYPLLVRVSQLLVIEVTWGDTDVVSSVHGMFEGSEFGFHLRDYVHQRNQRGGFRNLSGWVLKSTKREVEKQLAKHYSWSLGFSHWIDGVVWDNLAGWPFSGKCWLSVTHHRIPGITWLLASTMTQITANVVEAARQAVPGPNLFASVFDLALMSIIINLENNVCLLQSHGHSINNHSNHEQRNWLLCLLTMPR